MSKTSLTILSLLVAAILYFIAPENPRILRHAPSALPTSAPNHELPGANSPAYSPTGNPSQVQDFPPSTIIVGSFNIQVFGVSKMNKPAVVDTLVDVARRFDLLAIQELRSKDQTVMDRFVTLLNADGAQYRYIPGPRQGYSSSKEQYVLVFDSTKFRVTESGYVAPNPDNTMHRPPFVTSFECVQAPPGKGFTFTVLNVHTDPDVVDREFRALESIMPLVYQRHPNEDDFLIMGDFNGDATKIQQYRWLNNQLPLVRPNWKTAVRSGRSLDNIVLDGVQTTEYRNQAGVLDLALEYQLTQQQVLLVSDHFPVWSIFSTVESQGRFVNRQSSGGTTR